jgi:Holliday junction resolvasome RuvABC endonuclease subunit
MVSHLVRTTGEQMTRVLGLKCSRESLDWAIVEGDSREEATVVQSGLVKIPEGDRGEQLCWVRMEIQELITRHKADSVMLRGVEAARGNPIPRAEIEGVVQEAVAASGLKCRRLVSASIRSAFGVRNGHDLEQALTGLEVVMNRPKTRREPVTAALIGIGVS